MLDLHGEKMKLESEKCKDVKKGVLIIAIVHNKNFTQNFHKVSPT
jgi:uncharacterized protein YktB (UPF0637 family)